MGRVLKHHLTEQQDGNEQTMKSKRTLSDFALWAALPMAQTSKIESRLTMILDKTRSRRAIARRVLLLALVPATAALVTLAVLRPDAKAQTTTPSLPAAIVPSPVSSSGTSVSTGVQISLPRNGLSLKMQTMTMRKSGIPVVSSDMTVNGTTLFAGATNPGKYGSQWWSASGALLPEPVYDRMPFHAANLGSADADAVSFAFRLPPAMQGVTVQYKLPQSTESSSDGTWPTKTQDSAGRTESQVFAGSGGTRIVTVGYPPELKTATIQVGMAAGAWTTAVDRVLNSSGVAGANTTTNFSGQAFLVGDAAQTTKGTALTVSTNSQDDTRIIALDGHGKTLFPADIGDESTDSLKQITAHFSQPLSQIKEFRVETRPFQWIEFKDVALQPAK